MADTFYKSFGAPPKFSPLTIDGTAKVLVIAMLIGGFPGLNPEDRLRQCRHAAVFGCFQS